MKLLIAINQQNNTKKMSYFGCQYYATRVVRGAVWIGFERKTHPIQRLKYLWSGLDDNSKKNPILSDPN